jgi:hypothetical protein
MAFQSHRSDCFSAASTTLNGFGAAILLRGNTELR